MQKFQEVVVVVDRDRMADRRALRLDTFLTQLQEEVVEVVVDTDRMVNLLPC